MSGDRTRRCLRTVDAEVTMAGAVAMTAGLLAQQAARLKQNQSVHKLVHVLMPHMVPKVFVHSMRTINCRLADSAKMQMRSLCICPGH